ncbi:MAG: hypothetical protein K0S32_3706 [Bacteroidetes bacterium]|jgi:hypothetical protein|nr:hypothetical protein [Bacteroidota bacterium]
MQFLKGKAGYILLVILATSWCYIESFDKGDFYIFLSAANDLNGTQNIFENKYVDGYHYYYSVLFALILKPLVWLPFFWVKFCWLLLNVFLYFKLFQLLLRSELVQRMEEKQKWIFLLVIFVFSLRFLRDNIHTAQITILILWSCVYGLYYISKDKPALGALILCIGINIKLLPIVFLPYLLYRGNFKALFYTLSFYCLFLFLPSVFIGHEYNMSLLKTWLHLINPTNQNHVLDVDERSFHGLSTLLSTLLVKDVPDLYAMNIRRNIADVPLATLSLILLIVRLILVSVTLYFLRWSWFKKAKSKWQQCIEISYILYVIPLIFPHQQHYAFLFCMPAVCCICYYLFMSQMNTSSRKIYIAFLAISFLCFNLKILVGEFNNYYEHFKILTYGALLLIPLMIMVWKNSRKENLFVL